MLSKSGFTLLNFSPPDGVVYWTHDAQPADLNLNSSFPQNLVFLVSMMASSFIQTSKPKMQRTSKIIPSPLYLICPVILRIYIS